MKKAVIVIPTYNESKNIDRLVNEIFTLEKQITDWSLEILVIDSGSPDGTARKVKSLIKKYSGLHLLVTKKEGLGQAYIRGFEYALQNLKPFVIFEMDGDHSHNPKKIPEFLKKIEEGSDFVIGSRYRKGGSIPKNWGLHRKLFSVLGNLVIRFGFMKPRITDWTSGYRAIKVWVIEKTISSVKKYTGYVFQVAIIDNALKNKAIVQEVPINFIDRKHGVSKINSVQYIIQTLWYVFTNSSFIKYLIVGVLGATIDFGISFILIEKLNFHRDHYWMATAISAEAAIISNFLLNNFWSFSHKKIKSHATSYISQFFKFNLVSSGALAIQAIGIQVLASHLDHTLWYVYKVFILAFIIIPYSYILYNKVIWREKTNS